MKRFRFPWYSLTRVEDVFLNRRYPIVTACSEKDVRIFVFHHRTEAFPDCFGNRALYVPFRCGCGVADSSQEGMGGGNIGDNISAYNAYLNEMTGIYWIGRHYKEIGSPDYIGFGHYRRYLDWTPELLRPGVLFASRYVGLYSNRRILVRCNGTYGLDVFMPHWTEVFGTSGEHSDIDVYMEKARTLYLCNIFLTDKATFFRYYAFIEKCIVLAVRLVDVHRLELDAMTPRDRRAFSFLLERLTSYWIWHEKRAGRLRVISSQLRQYDIANPENSNR